MQYLRHGSTELELNPPFQNPGSGHCWVNNGGYQVGIVYSTEKEAAVQVITMNTNVLLESFLVTENNFFCTSHRFSVASQPLWMHTVPPDKAFSSVAAAMKDCFPQLLPCIPI